MDVMEKKGEKRCVCMDVMGKKGEKGVFAWM